jgi:hypothetical protein
MRKSHFLILIWLSVCGSAFTVAQAQPRLYGCSRSTIEAYPEEEKRPVLEFFDEARALADKSVKLFAEGRIKELYPLMSTHFRNEYTEARLWEKLAGIEQSEGKIIEYEFRTQSLSYAYPPEIDFQRDHSYITYAVKTAAKGEGAYVGVYTKREGKEPVVVNIDLSRFSPDDPAEMRFPQARESACEFIKGPLKVKGQ